MKKILFIAITILSSADYLNAMQQQIDSYYISALPPEIVVNIIKDLSDQTLAHFAQTSKRYQNLAQKMLQARKQTKMLQQRELFKSKINGTRLDLSNMNLQYLMPGIFNDPAFNNLKCLDFTNNQLTALDPTIFNSLNNLKELSLNSNRLTTLNPTIFNNLNNLLGLYLYDNQLTALDPTLFNNLNNLRWLWITNNPLNEQTKQMLKPSKARVINKVKNKLLSYLGKHSKS